MIVIPAFCWRTVVNGFTVARGIAERVAFLDGVPFGGSAVDGGVVTTVAFPDADEYAGHYRVSTDAMREAGRHLRDYGLVRLAQVHTHRGRGVRHSHVDDELAFSQAEGTVSIVLPGHALTHPGLGDAGVHRRERSGWRRLDVDELERFVCVVPSEVDHRRHA